MQDMSKESRLREIALGLGANVYRLRTHKNLSLEEVAKKTGLNYHTIRRVELGDIKSLPKNTTLLALADLFEISVEELLEAPPKDAPRPPEQAQEDVVPKTWYEKAMMDLGVARNRIAELEAELKKK